MKRTTTQWSSQRKSPELPANLMPRSVRLCAVVDKSHSADCEAQRSQDQTSTASSKTWLPRAEILETAFFEHARENPVAHACRWRDQGPVHSKDHCQFTHDYGATAYGAFEVGLLWDCIADLR